MLRFIFFCMAFLAISFFAIPAYFGISKEHEKRVTATMTVSADTNTANAQEPLTFEEIYALADESLLNNPSVLNDIMPAAGAEKVVIFDDKFSTGFSMQEDSALADADTIDIINE